MSYPFVSAAALLVMSQVACGQAEVLAPAPATVLTTPKADTGEIDSVSGIAMADEGVSQAVELNGEAFKLAVRDGRCVLISESRQELEAATDLAPPCHVLSWQSQPPAAAGGASDGLPVGTVGTAMAWHYGSAEDATVVAVIGDPLQEDLKAGLGYRQRMEQGFHCVGSVQGVLIDDGHITATAKREQIGVLCAETGLDERDFWMLAHSK